jgi:hypothetical protein
VVVLEPTPRDDGDRRLILDRRLPTDRRSGEVPLSPSAFERRLGGDRRASLERRLSVQSAEGQIHGALRLLTILAEGQGLGDSQRRNLEAAMLRLRFALERLTPPGS